MPMLTMLQPGAPVAPFSLAADSVTVGDVTINFATEQQDTAAEIAIRYHNGSYNRDGAEGAIVAIVRIPPRQYTEQPGDTDPMTGEPKPERVAQPLDTNAVTVELWPFVA